MRWAAKRDDSEAGIVKALEVHGWTVFRLSDKGVPDLLAVKEGRAVPLECKSPGGTLTPAQTQAFERWLRAGMPVHVVHTPEEALAAIRAPLTEGSISLGTPDAADDVLAVVDTRAPRGAPRSLRSLATSASHRRKP